ncbi:MAG: caspase family protein [Candidatus Aminicenantes bacterium]|nr:caspase family protein [Candidatus Aminicenantes bacterium]
MMKSGMLFLAGWLGLSAGLPAVQNEPASGIRRFAVIVGANHGGSDRVRLRYAVSDARTINRILQDLGGVAPEDALLLLDPKAGDFMSGMKSFRSRVEEAKSGHRRIEVVFYYSGHSDETRLLLNEETIPYETLRETINGIPADVRIAILDSCASGAFTRLKGGKKKPSFLLDEAYDMKGYAFLTSSSATEASQESDLLRSSFFTHYLSSGLRGAADLNGDGRVTLQEAYQFAFNETLAGTTGTLNGPQHPNYDIEMSGAGDVVMTDIRTASAVLALAGDVAGRIFIHDKAGRLVLEASKSGADDRTVSLGLAAGDYRVVRITDGRIFEAEAGLKSGGEKTLAAGDFSPSKKKYTTPRGDRASNIREETRSRTFGRRPITMNLAQPTGAVLNRGEVLMGIGPVAFTLADGLQFGTNVFNVIGGVYNVDLKLALIRWEGLRVAAGLNWSNFDLMSFGEEKTYSSVSPYLVVSPRLSRKLTLHLGGRYAEFFGTANVEEAEYSDEAEGTMVFAGLDLDLSEKTKLLVEGGYDATFRALRSGAGFLFGGETFRFKLGFQYFQQREADGFTRLVTGLWWRL